MMEMGYEIAMINSLLMTNNGLTAMVMALEIIWWENMEMHVLMKPIKAIMDVLKGSKRRLKKSKVRPELQSLTSQF